MKYFSLLLCLNLFSCSSKQVSTSSVNWDLPKPPPVQNPASQRRIASEEYSSNAYKAMYEDQNYIGRLLEMRKLVRQLLVNMSDKDQARKIILQKFKDDLDKQISFLKGLEGEQQSELPISWLPVANSYQYNAKILSLQNVISSSEVMARLEGFIVATKVMEFDESYERHFYYDLLRRGLKGLAAEVQKVDDHSAELKKQVEFSYVNFFSSRARAHLHRVFSDKSSRPTEKRISSFFRQLQSIHNPSEARTISNSAEMNFARSTLAYANYSGSSEIEGADDDINTKISTYFGLEMIKYLYGQMN